MSIQFTNTGPTSSTHAAVVVPSDTADLAFASKGVWVGGAGDLVVTMMGGEKVKFTAVPAGTLLPICVSRIWSTSTTATLVLVIWE